MDKPSVESDKLRICVITAPLMRSTPDSHVHVVNLLHLLEPLSERIVMITHNFPEDAVSSKKIHIKNIKHRNHSRWMVVRIPWFIIMQLRICYQLVKLGKEPDIIFFSIGAAALTLPVVLARLMQKKVVYIYAGAGVIKKVSQMVYGENLLGLGGRVYPSITMALERINCRLSDKIIVFSSNSAQFLSKRYRNKVSVGSRFYVDDDYFRIERDINSRMTLIGYIGTLYDTKGVMEFVKAIPLIVTHNTGIRFMICGDGPLRDSVEKEIKEAKLDNVVTMAGWIAHDKIPHYLNKMKLVVIPSYYEVGPQLLLEAMACGTPTLAAPVGIVTDVIKDGETGFIMEDNSPECIAENVRRVLENPNLGQIANNARKLIEQKYTYKAATERYRKIFDSI